jgi:hypothetical protein
VDDPQRSWYTGRVAPPDVIDLKNQGGRCPRRADLLSRGIESHGFPVVEVPPHLGREDLPDFIAVPPVTREQVGSRPVKVRYRRQVDQYLAVESRRGVRSFWYAREAILAGALMM